MTSQIDGDVWQNELWTVKEVATYLRMGRVTVWRWCQQGVIPAVRMGRSWRIRRDDVIAFVGKSNWSPSDLPLANSAVHETDEQISHLFTLQSGAEEVDKQSLSNTNKV
jgi:excisionase family DNA binding protein